MHNSEIYAFFKNICKYIYFRIMHLPKSVSRYIKNKYVLTYKQKFKIGIHEFKEICINMYFCNVFYKHNICSYLCFAINI